MTDNINPKHYKQGKIEVIDFILDQKMGYLESNILKYICRYKLKNGLEFNWTVNHMQNLVDEVIHLNKSQLEPLQKLATIDRSKYFIKQ